MLWCAARGVQTKVTYIDPKDKPEWFLAISPKGSMPVARHGTTVVPDSKSIVEYVNHTWPDGAAVRGKGDVAKAVNRLEKSKLTDHLWTLLAKETEAEREAGRDELMKELQAIEKVLASHGGGGTVAGGVPSVGGAGGVCAVDLSLVPKLEHTLVAGRFLADPPFAPFAGGQLPLRVAATRRGSAQGGGPRAFATVRQHGKYSPADCATKPTKANIATRPCLCAATGAS